MNHLKSTLSLLSGVALVVGMAACGGSNQQSQPNTPNVGESTPPSGAQPYGTANEQGQSQPSNDAYGGAGAAPVGSSQTTQPSPSSTSQQGSTMGGAQGQYGQGQYGSQGASGSTSGQSGAMGSTNTMGGTMDVSSFNDAQIAAVVHAVNAGEIQEAQLAESKASSAEVKRFARDMVNHHRAMQSSATSAFQKANLTPSENAVSQQLTSDTQNELSMLQGVNGRDFDRDYIDSQVKDHSMALDLIDKMLPNAKDPQLKTMLQDARTKVEAHLRDAQRIQGTLQKGTTNRQGQGGSSNPSSGSGTQQSPTSP